MKLRLRVGGYPLVALLAFFLTHSARGQHGGAGDASASFSPGAEVGSPLVHNYSSKEYEAAGQVWASVQDHRGVMYFAISEGSILEYDGVTWRKILVPSAVIRSLAVGPDGRLWVGAGRSIGYLAPDAAGELKYVSLVDRIPAPDRDFDDVWQTLVTPQGVFFRTFERLFRWDGQRMQVWAATPETSFQALSAVRGHIYTSRLGTGLEEIVGDELRKLPGGDAYRDARKLFLHPFGDDRIVISARGGLLTVYDGAKSVPFPTAADGYLKQHQLYASILLRDGSICVTTLNGGAVIIGPDGKIRRNIDVASGIASGNVLSAYEDADGALWLGSDDGVARVEVNSPLSILSRTFSEDGIRFGGTIYITTPAGGSAVHRLVFDQRTGEPSLQDVKNSPTQGFALLGFKDPSGKTPDQLLAATSDGVMMLQRDTMVPAVPGLRGPDEQTYFIGVSKKNPARLLIGHGNGAGSFLWDGKRWIDEGRLPNVHGAVRNIAEDAQGVLWANGEGQVLRIELGPSGMRDAKLEVLGPREGLGDGPNDAEYIDGNIFVTVDRSRNILRWDPSTHRFVSDNRYQLPINAPDATSALIPTEDGSVWANTVSSQGFRLGVFRRQPDGTRRLEEDAYRKLNRFRVFRLHSEPTGRVLALSGDGLLSYDPRTEGAAAPVPFETLVRQVNIGSKVLFAGANADAGSGPHLPPGSNALRFQFAAPTYANPANTSYQYLLEGADKEWSAWGKQKEANYNGLGPGDYRFRVRSRADDGRSGQEGVYAFTILPPWYRTRLAYLIYALLFLLLAFTAWRLITRHEREKARRKTEELEQQAKALEVTIGQRTEEIRAQAAEIAAQKESIELLSEIGKEITSSLDLDTILFKLYECVNQVVDATIFGVGLYRPEKHVIEYSLAIESGKRYAPYTRSTEDKNQFAVWCIENRKPILINDVASEYSQYISSYSHTGGVLEDGTLAQPPASMIYLPLIAQERILGVLSVQSFRRNAYTEHHLRLLENLAAYTTIALDNANAYLVINEREHQVRERAAELATINRITQALATQLDRDSLIQLVGDQVREVFRAPIVYVSLLDRSTMTLYFPYTFGEDAPSRPFGTGLTSQIIRTGQPLLINEDMDRNRNRLGIEQIGRQTASFLGVPIRSGGHVIGVISVQSTDQEGRFTEDDQRLLSTIASAVGVTIHNASLFDDARQAREAAEQADAAKSSFLSTVSHELRTPLTSVLGFAKIIRRRLEERLFPLIPEDDKKISQAKRQVLENLAVVVSEGERLTKLIDDVLDLAKIEAGKFTWNMVSVSVAEVMERAVAATSSLFEPKNLQLICDVAPALPPVHGDPDRLIQVVINLISNAVKFTDAGRILCSARLREGQVLVSVTDSGIGISPADQPKVFEKFKQVGDTLTDKPKGTGLGLPICKEIVEYHGGAIWVESQPGRGSTFSFTLPVPDTTKHIQPPPTRHAIGIESLVRQLREQSSTAPTQNKSVLVVDDDPNIRSLLRQELTEAGYAVRLAEDGRKALALIREEVPGLVILDVMMPEMNGFDVAAVLKNDPATTSIPIIILSIVEDKERGFRLGVDRYLTKPIDTPTLFHEIDTLLDQGKSRKKVMVVDEDASTIRTLTDVLETRGYEVVESDGSDLLSRAVTIRPDIIILNSVLSSGDEVRALRFEKGMENVLFLIYP